MSTTEIFVNDELTFGMFVRGVQADLSCSELNALEAARVLVNDRSEDYMNCFGGPIGRSTNVRSLLSGAFRAAIKKANELSLGGGSSLRLDSWTALNKSMREVEKLLDSGIPLVAATEMVVAHEIFLPLFRSGTLNDDGRYIVIIDAFWEKLGFKVHAV